MLKERYAIPASFARTAHTRAEDFSRQYAHSIEAPEQYWAEVSQCVEWQKPFTKVKNVSWDIKNLHIKWFEDGELNVSVNCLDRHVRKNPERTAIIWEGDEPDQQQHISYRALLNEVCQLGNAMRRMGVKKGDRVTIYMPMVPQAAVAMLACTRIGAVHSVVFGGFSPDSLAGRIHDCDSQWVITADEGLRGGKKIPLKANVDAALAKPESAGVKKVIVVQRTGGEIEWTAGRDEWYHELLKSEPTDCTPEVMNAEDPLFILYTSGSTGKPKGILHTTGGYLVYVTHTFKHVFDIKDDDIYWCTADVGWITGHSYLLYGALSNGASTVFFESVPNYPDWGRIGKVVDKHKVTILYTAPTAIRAMMREGDEWVKQSQRTSLRLLGSVGEPINPEAWRWYYEVIGDSRCPIVDTWWQTETGGILLSPLPGATELKPGSATRPLFGIQPAIVDAEGKELSGACEGNLIIKDSWPGQMRSVYGDHQRFVETYFSTYPGQYFTGDGARRDEDGYYWITGRVDDVLNVSGHRLGTAEVESSLVAHPSVAEAAVVGMPHDIKGQGIYAFVTLHAHVNGNDTLRKELINWVRKDIGPIASPDVIQWAPGLPKTRSGKIMRRILRKIAANETENLGDTSTLADPGVVEHLISGAKNR